MSTSSSDAVISSCATTARSARSASTPRAAPTRISSRNAWGSWPVASRYCSRLAPWCERRCARSSTRRRVSASTSVEGGSTGTRSAAASSTLSRAAICTCIFCTSSRRLRMSARSSSTVANSLASCAHSSVSSGSTFRFASLTTTRNVTSWPAWGSFAPMYPPMAPAPYTQIFIRVPASWRARCAGACRSGPSGSPSGRRTSAGS